MVFPDALSVLWVFYAPASKAASVSATKLDLHRKIGQAFGIKVKDEKFPKPLSYGKIPPRSQTGCIYSAATFIGLLGWLVQLP
jgi:hypothetical protein